MPCATTPSLHSMRTSAADWFSASPVTRSSCPCSGSLQRMRQSMRTPVPSYSQRRSPVSLHEAGSCGSRGTGVEAKRGVFHVTV